MKLYQPYRFLLLLSLSIFLFTSVNAQRIAAGGGHAMTICSVGTVQAWGNNFSGQLGNGTYTSSMTPVDVDIIDNVIEIAAGVDHSLALKNDSTVWAWGRNAFGKLGTGNYIYSTTPVQISALSGIIAISCGLIQSIALRSDGILFAWGSNANGELGNGTTTDSSIPVAVVGLTNVIEIAGGNNHFIALKNDSTVWAWGDNFFGELGDSSSVPFSSVPVQVRNLTGVTQISAGSNHSLALKSDGSIWSWGYNYAGQLGNGNLIDSKVPVQVNLSANITAIAGGGNFSLALKADSTVLSWGDNLYGQLGIGTTIANSSIPVPVTNLNHVVEINGGFAFSMALENDGTLHTWGSNVMGQLGDGTSNTSNIPVTVIDACLSTSLSSIENQHRDIKIFPTVSDGMFILSLNNDQIKNAQLYLYNSQGQLIFKEAYSSGENQINIRDKEDGFYFARIVLNGKIIFTQKMMKQVRE